MERKKCAEAERHLVIEQSKSEQLSKQVNDLEEQLFNLNHENDVCREKFENMLKDRDVQIKKLQVISIFDCVKRIF